MTTFNHDTTTAKPIGPGFIALQVCDLEASKAFYVNQIGLTPSPQNPPGVVVFATKPIPFAIRKPMANLDATSKPGWGVSLWIASTDADALHAQLAESGVPIILPPADGPFGRFFAFRDPDGYEITVHTEPPKQETATLDASSGYLTFINTFSVEPENADLLVENLKNATEKIFRHQPGFISANLHVSRDRRKVLNYAQWRSKEDYAAMSKLPDIQAHMKASAALATGFDPVDYDLREVRIGKGT
jgi:predicted enzyme related to lactoylglutathione lyase/quinol monooxygenase YgiN